ncbi:hypothetical protein TNCV_279861 [Trichonephila clavipes]|nr:hypothetical protein TNCV_279861 [Trichonephila clavipes]
MLKTIAHPTDKEVRSVIRILNVRNIKPVEIHRQVVKIYGKNLMSDVELCKNGFGNAMTGVPMLMTMHGEGKLLLSMML